MGFTTDTLKYKAYTFKTRSEPIVIRDQEIKLQKQSDGSYNVPTSKILVKVYAAALNPVDLKIHNLAYWPVQFILGYQGLGKDYSGRIVAIGKKAQISTHLNVGDLVQGFYPHFSPTGTLSEYILVDGTNNADKQITNIPSNITLAQAASWPLVYGTTYQLTHDYNFTDKKVLILGGATSVGRYLIQVIKSKGAKEIIVTCSPRSVDLVKQLGATNTIDYTQGSILNPTLEFVKDGTFDHIYDCIGNAELFPSIYDILPSDGSGNYQTIVGDGKSLNLSIKTITSYFTVFKRRFASIIHTLGYNYRLHLLNSDGDWIKEGRQLIEDGHLKIFVDTYFKFEDLDKAIELLATEKANGKVVVKIEE
ncbi:hypothetical protein DFJ63DRAFT_314401 [Scheffersomyces coipomensis]|uniref:uncharacterized protein n=1 Tax=Scheffersomyces coipomensis TaxID=1788519 RepID=UPI00315D34CB